MNGQIIKDLKSLCVYRNLLKDEVLSSLLLYLENGSSSSEGEFLSNVFKADCEENIMGYISAAILGDDNIFTRKCATKRKISDTLKNAAKKDLDALYQVALFASDKLGKGKSPYPLNGNYSQCIDKLQQFHRRNGFGVYMENYVFSVSDGAALVPVKNFSPVRLADLKGYEEEKKVICENIENFILGLPYSNMLLYGDRGTGKSSTVHAVINEYKPKIKIVEMKKPQIKLMPAIIDNLSKLPFKFMIFIDDLALSDDDEHFAIFKASLEGSLQNMTSNIMTVVTSNRRHIVKETNISRDNIHINDVLNEQISLSDRFGLTVLFSSCNKAEYLDIVKKILRDRMSELPENIDALAEKYSVEKGSRSPRVAKQFADFVYSRVKRNIPLADF